MPDQGGRPPPIDLPVMTQAVAFSLELRHLEGRYLLTKCGCRSSSLPISLMVAHGARGTLGNAIRRMRCERCRSAPAEVILAQDSHGPNVAGMMGSPHGWWIRMV